MKQPLLPERALERGARIFAVVVLYGQEPSDSVTVATLASALAASPETDCAVLVYDNSPANIAAGPADAARVPAGFRYGGAQANRGLVGAYEAALTEALTSGYDWLLTLDQDTALPADFFSAIQPGLKAAAANPRIAAIVPHLMEGERRLSPAYVGLGRPQPLPTNFSGVPEREVRAFNSAALLRVAAVDAIGGFDPCFWLDHLDSWLHHQLFLQGWRMFVLDAVRLEHHLSLLNYRERLSPARLRNFLSAEGAYIDLYGSPLARFVYTVQLAGRLVNQAQRGETREVRQSTWAALVERLRLRRARRLAGWRKQAGCAPPADTPMTKPRKREPRA